MLTNCFAICYVFFFCQPNLTRWLFQVSAHFGCIVVNFWCLMENAWLLFPVLSTIWLASLGWKMLADCFAIWYVFYCQPDLNKFLALGHPAGKEARATLQKLLSGMLIISWILLLVRHLVFVLNYMRQSLMRKKILNLCKLQLFSKETEELTRFV